jgi:spermidine/putrescine transport system ATP-binding protein
MADTVIVMNDGAIEQLGQPEEIYNEPENKWVAEFIGEVNIIEDGIFVKNNLVKFANKEFKCLDTGFGTNEIIDIAIRPEDLEIVKSGKGFLNGKILSSNFQGVHYEYRVEVENGNWKNNFIIQSTKQYKDDESIAIKWDLDTIHVMWKDDHEYTEEHN